MEVATENPQAMESCLIRYNKEARNLEVQRKTLAERILITAKEKIAPQISSVLPSPYSINLPDTQVAGIGIDGRPTRETIPVAFAVRFKLNYNGKPLPGDNLPEDMDRAIQSTVTLRKRLSQEYGLVRIGLTFTEVQIG